MMTTKEWALAAALTATLGFGCEVDDTQAQQQQPPPTFAPPPSSGDGVLAECVEGEDDLAGEDDEGDPGAADVNECGATDDGVRDDSELREND